MRLTCARLLQHLTRAITSRWLYSVSGELQPLRLTVRGYAHQPRYLKQGLRIQIRIHYPS